jgi:uncharacterized protein (DUF1919 family)
LGEGDEAITVYFMHYQSFAEAKDKWIERAKRVDPQNTYIIFEYPSYLQENSEVWKSFGSIEEKSADNR